MKTIFTSIVLIFTISLASAQSNKATPNAGFEYWSYHTSTVNYFNPDSGWTTLNPTLCPIGYISCIKDSSNPHSGKFDAQLVTQDVIIQVAPAAMTTGTINTTNKSINGGIPYTLRPDSMIGWYHYLSVSGDNGDCEFYLFGATHADTIGQAFFKTPTSTVTAWTRFALPIKYTSSATPDTALWIFSSSLSNASAQTGSQLFIDDIGLVFHDTASAVKNINKYDNISVWPTPTTGPVSVNNGTGSSSLMFTLVDISGRKIEEERLSEGVNNFDLAGLSAGMYIYLIQDGANAVVKTGKIIVQK